MKKAGFILLSLCMLSIILVVGIFIGRNTANHYESLPMNSHSDVIAETEAPKDYRLNINTASKAQLMSLPGIGEIIADRILAYRDNVGSFQSTDQLLEIEGIGKKKLAEIENMITVGG